VSERLPLEETDEWYLAYGCQFEDEADRAFMWWVSAPLEGDWITDDSMKLYHVTHWLPLPLNPVSATASNRAPDTCDNSNDE
jgi:hypothetical protein